VRGRPSQLSASATPASEPNVPGAFGMYPRPNAVAIASEMRGLRFGDEAATDGTLLDMVVAVFFGIVGRQFFSF